MRIVLPWPVIHMACSGQNLRRKWSKTCFLPAVDLCRLGSFAGYESLGPASNYFLVFIRFRSGSSRAMFLADRKQDRAHLCADRWLDREFAGRVFGFGL